MQLCRVLLTVAAVLLPASAAQALDVVRTVEGQTINGTLNKITEREVSITRVGSNEPSVIPVNQIESIQYEGEPAQLRLVRPLIANGNFEGAKQALENPNLDPSKVNRQEAKQEILFFRALTAARLARTPDDVKAAGAQMFEFVQNNPTNWHYFEAVQVLGDLLVAVGNIDQASQQYAKLESAPWPDVQMRGAVARGRALQSQGKFAEALAAYEKALQLAGNSNDGLVGTQKLAATVGKAACLAETGKAAEGIKLVEDVIANAKPEDARLHAAAFTALGNCYLKSNPPQPKEAFLSFLKVDVLYPSFPEYHAEALYNLSKLWKEVQKPERGLQAKEELIRRYSASPWASKE